MMNDKIKIGSKVKIKDGFSREFWYDKKIRVVQDISEHGWATLSPCFNDSSNGIYVDGLDLIDDKFELFYDNEFQSR